MPTKQEQEQSKGNSFVFTRWKVRTTGKEMSNVFAFNPRYNQKKHFEQALSRAAKASGLEMPKPEDAVVIIDFRYI